MEDESLKDDIIALLLKMERGEAGLGEYQLTRNHTKGILLVSNVTSFFTHVVQRDLFILSYLFIYYRMFLLLE